jgi:pyruvate,water dikinase
MRTFVLDLRDIDSSMHDLVGGKAANLGELTRIDGVRVPDGFCVTTDAFRANGATVDSPIRDDVQAAIVDAVCRLGEDGVYAVRSSATAEDLVDASFAGQHESYLNVSGTAAILDAVRRCWASLLSERAVAYRRRNGIDDRDVAMAVVVQSMVAADAAGVMFTADPVSGSRRVTSIETVRGLGDALVSGTVNADVFTLRDGEVIARRGQSRTPAIADRDALALEVLGRRIEEHFGHPQDVEWCLADGEAYIVQSRPITTLFPVPVVSDDKPHVYVSTGHQQMMTDAMRPLGISVRQLNGARPFYEAGGRLFVDIARELSSPAGRAAMVMLGKSDPLIGDAIQTLVARNFIPLSEGPTPAPSTRGPAPTTDADPSIVEELIARGQASNAALEAVIEAKTGADLFEFIISDLQELKRVMFDPQSHQAVMAGMEATWWLNDHLEQWLGEKNAADVLAQSVPNNVTSQMGLDLLDVADAIRPHPEVVEFLSTVDGDDEKMTNDLASIPGGAEARAAIESWLDRYGMRCVGEIDITRPRWSERPSTIVPWILAHIRHFDAGEAERRFEQGLRAARLKMRELLQRLGELPDGDAKASEVRGMADRLRAFAGYREYPKYYMVSRYFIYKRALLREADRLVERGVFRDREDCYFLTMEELVEAARTNHADASVIDARRKAFASYERLTPPRVFTSEGEIIFGSYRRDDLPVGALVGLPVSAGTVEGRARVLFNPADAELELGDILITPFTDPSWTPSFLAIKGLVTEVGGLMTHGAVIAREYGLPAVVGVEHATTLIRDGQRIRLHGTEGYIELLD